MFSFVIDFDEVLADANAYTLAYYNSLYPAFPLQQEDITSFHWEDIPGSIFQTREENTQFWNDVGARQQLGDILLVQGAAQGVQTLHEMGHTLHLITARHKNDVSKIQSWCEKYFGEIFSSYHALGGDHPTESIPKGIYAKNLGITHALDDGGHNIDEYIKHNIRAYCFNAPWNKNHPIDSNIRVDSWDEFIIKIHHEMNIGKSS